MIKPYFLTHTTGTGDLHTYLMGTEKRCTSLVKGISRTMKNPPTACTLTIVGSDVMALRSGERRKIDLSHFPAVNGYHAPPYG